MLSSLNRKTRLLITAVVLSVGALLYFIFDPATSVWAPKCMFRVVTGYDCPGCGSQRAIHALLHADFISAWRSNALLVLSLPFLVAMAFASLFSDRFPGLHRHLNSLPVAIMFVIILIIWWIIRNL